MNEDSISQTSKFRRPDVILFTVQVSLIFIVVCVSLVNLSLSIGNPNFWTLLLTSSLGYIMPNPKMKLFPENVKTDKSNN